MTPQPSSNSNILAPESSTSFLLLPKSTSPLTDSQYHDSGVWSYAITKQGDALVPPSGCSEIDLDRSSNHFSQILSKSVIESDFTEIMTESAPLPLVLLEANGQSLTSLLSKTSD